MRGASSASGLIEEMFESGVGAAPETGGSMKVVGEAEVGEKVEEEETIEQTLASGASELPEVVPEPAGPSATPETNGGMQEDVGTEDAGEEAARNDAVGGGGWRTRHRSSGTESEVVAAADARAEAVLSPRSSMSLADLMDRGGKLATFLEDAGW